MNCVNCDSTNTIIISYELSGWVVRQISGDSSNINVSEGTTARYLLTAKHSCRQSIRFFTGWYVFVICLFGLLMLILIGYGSLKKGLLEGW